MRQIPDIWFASRSLFGETPAEAVATWMEQERLERQFNAELCDGTDGFTRPQDEAEAEQDACDRAAGRD